MTTATIFCIRKTISNTEDHTGNTVFSDRTGRQKQKGAGDQMEIVPYSDNVDEYLKHDDVIDHDNEAVKALADELFRKAADEIDFIKRAYTFVRDDISHSSDIDAETVTCAASEVLREGHGICFAKSHLMAAILRSRSVPAGFCYQKIIFDDETAPFLISHGLNGVYLKDQKKWIRLDARGNRPGVNAQFSTETEQLAYPIRPETGETDGFVVYPDPDRKIVRKLREAKTKAELWNDLPAEIDYEGQR